MNKIINAIKNKITKHDTNTSQKYLEEKNINLVWCGTRNMFFGGSDDKKISILNKTKL